MVEVARIYIASIDKYVIFDKKYEQELQKYNWHANNRGYACTNIPHPVGGVVKGKKRRTLLLMHRLIMKLEGKNGEYDHANRDRLDNRVANLQIATRAENAIHAGIRSDNTSGFKGVYLKREGKWGAVFRTKHIGYFKTKEEAAIAYNKALALVSDVDEKFKVYNKI